MGNICKSKKGRQNYIFDVLQAKDPEQLRKLVSALNVASKDVQITLSAQLGMKESALFRGFVDKICIRIQRIKNEKLPKKRKAEGELRKIWFQEKFANWVAMKELVKPLVKSITTSWTDDFYPLEVWKWYKHSENHLTMWWQECFRDMPGFEEEVPDFIKTAVREIAKSVCLDFHLKLEKQIDASCYDMNVAGETPLITAIKEWDDFDKLIMKEKWDEEKEIAWKNAVHLFIYLLSQLGCIEDPDTDKDATDQFGWTCLIWAAALGSYEICEILLLTTANLDFPDPCGRTPLMLATENNHTAIVKLLVENKANIDHKDCFGRTALHHAVINGNAETTKLLGSDIEKESLLMERKSTFKWFSKNNKTMPINCHVKEPERRIEP